VILAAFLNSDTGKAVSRTFNQVYDLWFGGLADYGAISQMFANVNYAYDWIAFNLILANDAQGLANFTAEKQAELIALLEQIRVEALQKGNNEIGANYLWTQFCRRHKALTNNQALNDVCSAAVDASKSAVKYIAEQEKPGLVIPWWVYVGLGLVAYRRLR